VRREVTVGGFRDLLAWQRAIDLAEAVYAAMRPWPGEELYGLTAQVRQAAVSVMANIAEGNGRTGSREFLQHLSIADGSLAEVEAHLLAQRLGFLDEVTVERLVDQIEETRRLVRGLIRGLR
jgi:four helix bundle protein